MVPITSLCRLFWREVADAIVFTETFSQSVTPWLDSGNAGLKHVVIDAVSGALIPYGSPRNGFELHPANVCAAFAVFWRKRLCEAVWFAIDANVFALAKMSQSYFNSFGLGK